MKTLTLARHLILHPGEALPPYAVLYDYVLAGNGVFIRARRKGVQACVPIDCATCAAFPRWSQASCSPYRKCRQT
jgi:hypothetical protein